MPKVALVQVIYNTRKFLPIVFPAAMKQTEKDSVFYAVIAGNEDNGKEYIEEHFPEVKIIDPGYNIGFSLGHKEIFEKVDAEFFQLVNPDLVMTENFVEEMLKPFSDNKVGAVSGKLLQYDFKNNKPTNIIDSTGVTISKSGGARDRGQHQVDSGQFDSQTDIIAVSGAGAMYRRAALESIKYPIGNGQSEYFDEDFFMYWEDVDLSWRMVNAGWKIKYNPNALAYHGRAAGSSPGGYKKVFAYIKHHRKIPAIIRKWNYRNHIYMFIKNSPKWYLQFFAREFFYNIFVLIFETGTFAVLPQMFRQLPKIWKKRKFIQQHRKISTAEMERLMQ